MRLTLNTATLKFRLTVVVIGLVLLATSVLTFVSLYLAERQMRDVIGSQQVALLSSAAAYIDADLESRQTLLKTLREELGRSGGHPAGGLQAFLEAHATLREEFFNVLVFDSTGTMLANMNDRRTNNTMNFGKRAYFTDTVAAREGVISKPFKSALSGKPVILVTEPLYDEQGKLIFMLGGAIDLQRPRFFGQLTALGSGATGYLFMLTSAGTIIHHPNKERILQRVQDETGGAVASTMAALDGFEGWVEGPTKRGVRALITYKRLRKTDWILGAVYPVDEAFTPLIHMRPTALLASVAVAALAGLAGWLAILRLLRPLGALRGHVAGIVDGSAGIEVFNVRGHDEFGELSRAFYTLSQQRRQAELKLEAQARTDILTGIDNRRMFEETFAAALGRAARGNTAIALAYLDIDHFKTINDTYGHKAGDEVLVEFARRLRAAVRSTDSVARLAGDEFVAIFEGLRDDVEPTMLAEKILDMARTPFLAAGASLQVSTSVGIAVGRGNAAGAGDYLALADEALYAAKQAGRDRYAMRRLGAASKGTPQATRPQAATDNA
ncbi:sensor domain-containing diguanylate cyclase [Massilia pseudoviolaceinigra]|uniref:sensor domain-containing diguanylate cyclase n=1 Tax=Massilia pseudoviolaceinigra TaxID=3057165 RepID=UPI002796AF06|nr:sensor domain-containing diguanylate cyclase [Massilia sp. CCM 9206]MDQ1919382.1 sensor domain-containing diguanylate cyclase [Massilia sp. CCM 9206]